MVGKLACSHLTLALETQNNLFRARSFRLRGFWVEKENGHVSCLALFTGRRLELAFHPPSESYSLEVFLNIGRLWDSVPGEPLAGAAGPVQSLY